MKDATESWKNDPVNIAMEKARVRYLAGSGQVHYRTAKGVARSMDALD